MKKDGVSTKRRLGRAKATFWKWVSPVRWAALTLQLVHRYVHRNTIIFFSCLEILVAVLMAVVFYIYPDIDDVGYIFKDWKWFAFFSLIRVVSAVLGIYAASNRKVNLMKSYFSMTVFHLFVSVLLIAPFICLQCRCSDYRQCVALGTFTSQKMDNPFPEPNKVKYESIRRVPYQEPPERFDGDGLESSDLDVEDFGEGSSMLETGRAWAFVDESAEVYARGLTVPPMNGTQPEKVDLLSYYNISHPTIHWESEKTPTCKAIISLEGADGQVIAFNVAGALAKLAAGTVKLEQLSVLYDQETSEDKALTDIGQHIWRCGTEDSCGVVEVRIHYDEKNHKTLAEVCNLEHQAVPSIAEAQRNPNSKQWAKGKEFETWKEVTQALEAVIKDDVAPQVGKDELLDTVVMDNFHMFFQKDPVRASAGYLLTQRLFNRQEMTADEGTKLMVDVFNQECVCERQSGCQAYYDSSHQPRHWCYVNQATVRYCYAQGIKVYRAKDSLKWFSEEICQNAGCKCMGVGAVPGVHEEAREQELDENKLNYGSSCKAWNTDDPEKWCNVGFDSTCNDRFLPEAMDNKVAVNLYRSAMPCDLKQKLAVGSKAKETCTIIRVLSLLMLVMLNALGVPMTMIIFTFVKNRCGDEFEADTQFEVKFSSDSETDNDWDVDTGTFVNKEGTDTKEAIAAAAAAANSNSVVHKNIMEATSFEVPDT